MSCTILLVDDTFTCREPVATCLRVSGYRVVCAADARQALDLLGDVTPDVLLLDLAMRGMDGIELVKELRRTPQWADLPVILFTGSGDVLSAFGDGLHIAACLVKSHASLADIRNAVQQAVTRMSSRPAASLLDAHAA